MTFDQARRAWKARSKDENVANSFLDTARSFSAAPRGLEQQTQRQGQSQSQSGNRGFAETAQSFQDFRQPKWVTGGQTGSTESGWDTPFYRKMFSQMEEADKSGIDAPSLMERKDYTGIIANDSFQTRQVGQAKGAKFGDIFEDGKRVGNLYESYDKKKADAIMGQLMLDPETQRQMYSSTDPEALDKEIQRVRKDATKNLDGYLTSKDYQDKVQQEQRVLLDNTGVRLGTDVAGAIGGGAVLGGIGVALGIIAAPFTGGLSLLPAAALATGGAIVGATAAELNRDQITEEMARAKVQQELHPDSDRPTATGLMNWSALAQKSINPLSNLAQGIVDSTGGNKVGDAKEGFYELTDDGKRKASGLQQTAVLAASFADAVGMANPLAAGIYAASMTGTIIGKAGELTSEGGVTFDDRSGTFRNVYEDPDANPWAAWGSAGIDVAQLVLLKGLGGKINSSWAAVGGAKAEGQIAKQGTWKLLGKNADADGWAKVGITNLRAPKGAVEVTERNGMKFYRDADGNLIDKVTRNATTYMVPSEMISSMPIKYQAMRTTGKARGAVTADDMWAAQIAMANGERKLGLALINGFGEATEEGIQALLDPLSLGYNLPDAMEVVQAMGQGFILGTGMSLGMGARAAGPIDRDFKNYTKEMKRLGQTPMSYEDFKAQKNTEREHKTKTSKVLADSWELSEKSYAEARMSGIRAVAGQRDAAIVAEKLQAAKDAGKANPATSGQMLIMDSSPGYQRGDSGHFSLTKFMQLLEANEQGLKDSIENAALQEKFAPEDMQFLKQAHGFVQRLNALQREDVDAFYTAQGDFTAQKEIVNRINRRQRQAYDGFIDSVKMAEIQDETLENNEVARSLRRAGTIIFTRYPKISGGSNLALMPQVDMNLTRENTNNVMLVSHAVLKLIDGDYDGDMMTDQVRIAYDRLAFDKARSSYDFFDDKGKLLMGTRGFNVNSFKTFFEIVNSPRDNRQGLITEFTEAFSRAVEIHFEKTEIISGAESTKLQEKFIAELTAGNPDAYTNFLSGIAQRNGDRLRAVGLETGERHLLRFDDKVQLALNKFDNQAAYTFTDEKQLRADKVIPDEEKKQMLKVSSQVRQKTATRMVTIAGQLARVITGDSFFRKIQSLRQARYTSPALKEETVRESPELQELIELYNEDQLELGQDASFEGNPEHAIELMALRWMTRWWKRTNPDLGFDNGLFGLSVVKVPVPVFKSDGSLDYIRNDMNSAQTALYMALKADQSFRRNTVTEADEIRWAKIEAVIEGPGMTAVREMMKSVQLADLGDIALAVFGAERTVEQVVREVSMMDQDTRAEWFRVAEADPAYKSSLKSDSDWLDKATTDEVGEVATYSGLTNYRLFIDMLKFEANHYMPYFADQSLVGGKLGDLAGVKGAKDGISYRTEMTGRKALKTVRDKMLKDLRNGETELTRESVQAAFAADRNLAFDFASLIPAEYRNMIFFLNNEELEIVPWMIDLLVEADPAVAMKNFWWNLQLDILRGQGVDFNDPDAEKVADLSYQKMPTTFTQLLWRLTVEEARGSEIAQIYKAQLFEVVNNAKDVFQVTQFINSHLRQQGEPAFITWVFDKNEFSTDGASLQVGSTPGAAVREALTTLSNRAKSYQDYGMTPEGARAEKSLAHKLELEAKALQEGKRKRPSLEMQNWLRMWRYVKNADESIGMRAASQQLLASMVGVQKYRHSKGQINPNDTLLGQAQQMTSDAPQFGNGVMQALGNLFAVDADGATMNPKALLRNGGRVVSENGEIIEQDELSDFEAAAYFMNAWQDSDNWSALKNMFFPTVVDNSGDTYTMQRYVLGETTLEGVTRGNYLSYLIEGDSQAFSNRYSLMQGMLDKYAKDEFVGVLWENSLLQMLATKSNRAYTNHDIQRDIEKVHSLFVRIMEQLGEVWYGEMGAEQLKDEPDFDKPSWTLNQMRTKNKQKLARQLGWSSSFWGKSEQEIRALLLQKQQELSLNFALVNDMRTDELNQLIEQTGFESPEVAAFIEVSKRVIAAQDAELAKYDPDTFLAANSEFSQMRDLYELRKGSKPEQLELVKARLLAFLLRPNMITEMRAMFGNEHSELFLDIQREFDRLTTSKPDFQPADMKLLSDKSWSEVSDLVLTKLMTEQTTDGALTLNLGAFSASQTTEKFWDPQAGWLFDMLLDPEGPIAKAAVDYRMQVKPDIGYDPEASIKLQRLFDELIEELKYAKWDPTVAVLTSNEFGYLQASGVEQATPEGGNMPKEFETLARVSTRNSSSIDKELYTSIEIPVTLNKQYPKDARYTALLDNTPRDIQIPVRLDAETVVSAPAPFELMHDLNNAAMRNLRLLVNGQPVQVPKFNSPEELTPDIADAEEGGSILYRFAGSEIRTLDVQRLQDAIGELLQHGRFDENTPLPTDLTAADVSIAVEFAHSSSKPAYDSESEAEFFNALQFDGVHGKRGADANKSIIGQLGLEIMRRIQTHSIGAAKKGLKARINAELNKFSKVKEMEQGFERDLEAVLRRKATELVKLNFDEADSVGDHAFKSMYRLASLLTKVKGYDEHGELVILSAPKVIWMQKTGQDLGLRDPQLVQMSVHMANSVYGNTTGMGLAGTREQAQWNITEMPEEMPTLAQQLANAPALAMEKTDKTILDYLRPRITSIKKHVGGTRFTSAQAADKSSRFVRLFHRSEEMRNTFRSTTSKIEALERWNQSHADVAREYLQMEWATTGKSTLAPELGTGFDLTYSLAQAEELVASTLNATRTERGRVTMFEPLNTRDTSGKPKAGVLHQASKAADNSGLGDVIVVNFGAYESIDITKDPEAQKKAITADLRVLMSSGATLVLAGTGPRDLRQWAIQNVFHTQGYRPENGNTLIQTYVGERGESKNQLSIRTARMAGHSTPASQYMLMAIGDVGKTYEGTTAVFDPRMWDRQFEVSFSIVPTQVKVNYGVPLGADAIKLKNMIIEQFKDPAAEAYLREISGIEKADSRAAKDLHKAVQKMLNWFNNSRGLEDMWEPGAYYGPGDLIPFVDSNQPGAVFFYRAGFKDNFRNADKQIREGAFRMGISKPELDQGVSFDEGTFQGFVRNGKYGLSAKIQMPYSKAADKQYTGSVKVLPRGMFDRSLVPDHSIGQHVGIAGVQDAVSADPKNADRIREANGLFQLFGWEPESKLIRTLFGVDITNMDEGLKNTWRGYLATTMRQLERNLPKFPIGHFDMLLDIIGFQSSAYEVLAPLLREVNIELASVGQIDIKVDSVRDSLLKDDMDLDTWYLLATYIYLSTEGSSWKDMTNAPGFLEYDGQQWDAQVVELDTVLTDVFNKIDRGSPAWEAQIAEFQSRVNGKEKSAYRVLPDGRVMIKGKPKKLNENDDTYVQVEYPVQLALWNMGSAGVNPAKLELAEARRKYTPYSYHNAATSLLGSNAYEFATEDSWRLKRFRDMSLTKETASLNEVFRQLNENYDSIKDSVKQAEFLTDRQLDEIAFGKDAVASMMQRIDKDDFSADEWVKYDKARKDFMAFTNVKDVRVIDAFVRANWGSVVSSTGNTNVTMSVPKMVAILNEMKLKLKAGVLPTFEGNIPMPTRTMLAQLYHGAQKGVSWTLDNGTGKPIDMANWDDWVDLAIGEYAFSESKVVDPLFRAVLDGIWQTYRGHQDGTPGQLPISTERLKAAGLLDDAGNPVLSLNPKYDEALKRISSPDLRRTTLDSLIGDHIPNEWQADSWQKVTEKGQKLWHRDKSPVARLKMSDIRKLGNVYKAELKNDNTFLNVLVNLRVVNALANPVLPVSALLEASVWGVLSNLSTALTGESDGLFSRLYTQGQEKSPRFREITENLFGQNYMTSNDLQRMKMLERNQANTVKFVKMLYGETLFQTPVGKGILDKYLGGAARFVSRIQDPMFMQRSDKLMKLYQEAALGYVMRTSGDKDISYAEMLSEFERDTDYFKLNHPMAHNAGIRKIEDSRGLKNTTASILVKGFYEPLAASANPLISYPATIGLKIPMLFNTYRFNVMSKVLGLQGIDAALAMTLHGRKKFWYKEKPEDDSTRDPYMDMTQAIESADLVNEFLKSGLSLTSLFMFGMAAGSLGLTGEDEETKRRKRMAHFQGWQFLYDPREIENDWRNQDAIFLDALPFNLDQLFNAGGGRSMGQMHWIIKQFAAPMMGMERFLNTGDVRQIMWGFEAALDSFPLVNMRSWTDTVAMSKELAAAAADAEEGNTEQGLAKSFGFLSQLMMSYERMLFENSFINMLYVGSDEYDRDPFKMVERDEHGSIISDRMGNAEETNALETYTDPETGEVRQGYAKNDWRKANQMGFAEKNLTYALFKSLTTGNFDLGNSPWLRKNMAVKERKIELPGIETQDAKDLILSIWNNETGREELTYDGARAVLNGLAGQSLNLSSPALQGVYLTYDQRAQIEEDWTADLIVQGVEVLGLSEFDAKGRAWDMMGGRGDYQGVGLKDIIWSKQIPYNATAVYQQLNTTYIQGPDGAMWATGVTRDNFLSAMGLPPIKRFYGENNQLGVDSRLNNTDAAFNLNTGMRGLKRKEDSYHIKTDEELLKESDERISKVIEESLEKLKKDKAYTDYSGGYGNYRYNRRGWVNYGRSGGYSRGGGSSYGSTPRVDMAYNIKEPYYRDVRTSDSGNPIIRRANIRRERFSSERGRLKPWQ